MRRFLLCAAALFAIMQLAAAPVDLASAQAKAQRFVQQQSYGGKLRAPIAGEMKLAHIETSDRVLGRAAFYIFNSDNGYVVVSADDRSDEILGYGDYPIDINTIPCNLKALLGMLKEQIEYLQDNPGIELYPMTLKAPARIASVSPLLTALWDQESPYWNQCVISGKQCLTGCPATSAAMVFHYWKYPDYETPEVPGYRCNLQTGYYSSQYVNVPALPPVTFDWEYMRDSYSGSYTTEEANAVATLMRYVGQAERMEYGTSAAGGSGVDADSVSLIADAFKFFGYDEETVRAVKKTSSYSGGQQLYTNEEWAALMQEELSEGRPIVFCAIAGGFFGGGHAFNVDGYDANTNKYHINFGWSGTSNNYYALNSFTGQGSTFNQYQQMVIGIQPPLHIPRVKVDQSQLSMTCYKNHTDGASFTVKGSSLEGNVTLTLTDESGVFSIDQTSLSPDEQGKVNQVINVTYAPLAEGHYEATVTISYPGVDDVVVTLVGSSDYELYRPVMLDLDATTVTATSFRADWTDQTPAENVASYTLEVMTKPDVLLLSEADWSEVPSESANHAADAANYLPEGWTFTGSYFFLDGGFISMNRNDKLTVNCDYGSYTKVSVIIKGKAYSKGSNTIVTVSSDLDSKTLTLAKDVDTYVAVLEVGADPVITITAGYYPEIQRIKIYGGEIVDPSPFILKAAESGDATYRLIQGITPDRFYTVTGLLPGTTYLYRVKSVYVNDTESAWTASKEVETNAFIGLTGDVNGDGKVDVTDIAMTISYVLGNDVENFNTDLADVNGDGKVDISDISQLILIVLN